MRYIKNIILASATVILLLTACDPDKFLGIKPRGKDVPTEYKHYDGLLTSFDMIKWTLEFNGRLYFPILSDEYIVTGRSFGELGSKMGQQGKECYMYNKAFLLPDDLPSDWGYNGNMYSLPL